MKNFYIMEPDEWDNDEGPEGWYAIVNDDEGIVAYAGTVELAYQIILALEFSAQ